MVWYPGFVSFNPVLNAWFSPFLWKPQQRILDIFPFFQQTQQFLFSHYCGCPSQIFWSARKHENRVVPWKIKCALLFPFHFLVFPFGWQMQLIKHPQKCIYRDFHITSRTDNWQPIFYLLWPEVFCVHLPERLHRLLSTNYYNLFSVQKS